MASDPNQQFLGAAAFQGAGYGLIAGGGPLGTNTATTLNVNGTLTHPLITPAFDPTIYVLNGGDVSPLLTLLQKEPMSETDAKHHNLYYWTEDRIPPEKTTATGSTAVGGTTLGVAYVDMFLANCTVWVPALNAYGLVSAVTGSGSNGPGTLTVGWFPGCVPAVAITAGMDVIMLGNSQPEIGAPVASAFTDKIQKYCVQQEFWYARSVSHRLMTEKWQIGTPLGAILPYETEMLRRRALLEGEKTLWFGQTSWSNTTGVGTLGGAYYAQGSRRWNFGGVTLTQANFEDFIDRGRRHSIGSMGKTMVFCSTAVLRQINAFASPQQRIQPGETRYGVKLHRWIPQDGGDDVELVKMPLWDFLGRDDLMCAMRMEPGAVSKVRSTAWPDLTYGDSKNSNWVVPLGGSWEVFGYKWRFSAMWKDAFRHVNWAFNIGSVNATTPTGLI